MLIPNRPTPSSPSVAGSGTDSLALALPATAAVIAPSVHGGIELGNGAQPLPIAATGGVTLVKVKPMAFGTTNCDAGMISLFSTRVSGGLPTASVSCGPAPNTASVKVPLSTSKPVIPGPEKIENVPL